MRFSDLTDRLADYLPHLMGALPLVIAIMVSATLFNLLLGRAVVLLARRTHLTELDVLPIRRILCWGTRIIALILILSVLGFQIGGIWAMLSTVLGLVAIGFVAVWSLISHTSATMLLLFLRPFQIGDDIEFAGEPVRGRVVDINFFFTTLVDHEGLFCQIPNNLFFQKTLKRRKNSTRVSLAVQLHARLPAQVDLPPPPSPPAPEKPEPVAVKEPDPTMELPDPDRLSPRSKPSR